MRHEEFMKQRMNGESRDNVNNPAHYNQAGIECLDAIAAATGNGYE